MLELVSLEHEVTMEKCASNTRTRSDDACRQEPALIARALVGAVAAMVGAVTVMVRAVAAMMGAVAAV